MYIVYLNYMYNVLLSVMYIVYLNLHCSVMLYIEDDLI